MGRLEDELKKRRNYAATFVLHYLTAKQIETMLPQVKPLRGKELADATRKYAAEHSWLRLTVSRIADVEVQFAQRQASTSTALWPILVRHFVKAEEKEGDAWQEVPLQNVEELLNSERSSLVEREMLVNCYVMAVDADRKEAEADPNFSERAS